MKNILSVDVEEWFHPEAVQHLFPRESWNDCEPRVVANVDKLLELFEKKSATATFFILGWIAERYPELIQRISDRGHEIASHGYSHRMVTKLDRKEFGNDLNQSIEILQDVSGKRILGFRAPTFSVVKQTSWAWEVIRNLGLKYDSSVYPIHHDRYGIPDAPRQKYQPLDDDPDFIEYPMSTLRILGKNIPFGGGGYLRIFPLKFTNWAISKLNSENIPAIIFIHPWEFDEKQPVLPLGRISKTRHYFNIKNNLLKLDHLLTGYRWTSFEEYLGKEN